MTYHSAWQQVGYLLNGFSQSIRPPTKKKYHKKKIPRKFRRALLCEGKKDRMKEAIFDIELEEQVDISKVRASENLIRCSKGSG